MGMKRIFVIIPALIVLLGISDVAFAKHHHSQIKDNKQNKRNEVPCLVKGVQQMVKSENVCKDFNGTVMSGKALQGGTTVSKGEITVKKTQSK